MRNEVMAGTGRGIGRPRRGRVHVGPMFQCREGVRSLGTLKQHRLGGVARERGA